MSAALALPAIADSTEKDPNSVVGPYQFPVRPGTAAWSELDTHAEKVAITQIPADYLARMTTKDLVSTVLEYPLFIDTLVFDSPQEGLERVVENFNGLRELFSRPDAGAELLNQYEADEPKVDAAGTDENLHQTEWRVAQLEALLASPAAVDSLDAVGLAELEQTARKTRSAKLAYPDIYGQVGEASTLRVQGQAILRSKAIRPTPSQRSFLRTGNVRTAREFRNAQLSVSTNPADLGLAVALDAATSVKTPKGSSVSAIKVTVDLTAAQKTNLNNQIAAAYPNVTRLRTATKKYNCHSYAWYKQSSTNNIWINNPSKYWTDGSYVPDYTVGHPKSKVRFTANDHSAISDNDTVWVSKWGQGGLYRHGRYDHPYTTSHKFMKRA